jgi:NAD dependent epimerase/dehydratase family enzyme
MLYITGRSICFWRIRHNGLIGEGFSVHVAKEWESVFFGFNTLPIRMVVLRMGIVLGAGGGALLPLLM